MNMNINTISGISEVNMVNIIKNKYLFKLACLLDFLMKTKLKLPNRTELNRTELNTNSKIIKELIQLSSIRSEIRVKLRHFSISKMTICRVFERFLHFSIIYVQTHSVSK